MVFEIFLHEKKLRDGYSALYSSAPALFRDLNIARADGSLRSLLARLSRIDVLVINDWAMQPLGEPERRDFWEIWLKEEGVLEETRAVVLKETLAWQVQQAMEKDKISKVEMAVD